MADIDSLEIQISAKATTAVNALNKLNNQLYTLKTSLSSLNSNGLSNLSVGISQLNSSMQGITTKTSDFTRLAKNIEKLGSVNSSQIMGTANALNQMSQSLSGIGSFPDSAQQISDLTKSISKLGNKNISTAIDNIPKLATSLKELMTTLSTTPQVSSNLIQMTNALSNFASQGSKIGTASRSLIGNFGNVSSSAKKTGKSFKGLASSIGKFYATYFLAIRGVKGLWNQIKNNSMDYVEVLNYFDASFGQVADTADLSAFEELGYKSAQQYYDSFSKRAKELTSKMTGFKITESGTLQRTNVASLGINPSELMNYQSMFAQMSSSMGMTAENATKVSQALTEIGADLASVKNMDFEKVWKDMASGLAGMSRTLDKYGVNIRNVNLQQKLSDLGIQANIQSLNQNEKALLRTIILLDTTKYAWGDLSETIDANNKLAIVA